MSRIKEIVTKNHTYYFFNDMINIKNFKICIKIVKKTYKNIIICYIGYITIKNLSYVKINIVNLLYFIINKLDGYTEKSIGNKYLTLVSTDEKQDALKNYTELWDKIKDLIKSIPKISNTNNL